MSDYGEPQLTVRLSGLGRDVTLTKEWSIDSSYLTPTDGFEFTLYDTDRAKLRGLELQPVELLIDGRSQALGRIDMTERGGDGTAITCHGRDYFADMTECHVDPTLHISKEMTLETAILLSASVVGISNVIADDDFSMREIRTGRKIRKKGQQRKRHKNKLDEYKPQANESIFSFLNRIVARMGGTMQPGNARDTVIITSPRYDQEVSCEIARLIGNAPGAQNVVMSGTATRDFSSFPTYILAAGKMVSVGVRKTPTWSKLTTCPVFRKDGSIFAQGAGLSRDPGTGFSVPYLDLPDEEEKVLRQLDRKASTTELAKVLSPELAEILGRAVVPGRRFPTDPVSTAGDLYRLMFLKDADSGDQKQLDRLAVRAFAHKFKDTLTYRCTLRGHSDPRTGLVWAVDTMVRIKDEVCEVDEPMWIASRKFSFRDGQGAVTELECWRPGSFTIDTNEDEAT